VRIVPLFDHTVCFILENLMPISNIQSMTGFATRKIKWENLELIWELKSVNNRFADAVIRAPDLLRYKENEFRAAITQRIRRGRIDATLLIKKTYEATQDLSVNEALMQSLCNRVADLQKSSDAEIAAPSAIEILKWPGVLIESEIDPEALGTIAQDLLAETVAELIKTRQAEGRSIAELIRKRCEAIATEVHKAESRVPEVMQALRDRLTQRLQELQCEPDPGRLEQEIVFYAHKMDVAEELDRLHVHLGEMSRSLESNEPVGRKLDFLTQELNREANTLGSKSQDAEMTKASVEIKVLIEQIKEQVQNVE
jgi:uncharacterized protein (TIGR00255 family)